MTPPVRYVGKRQRTFEQRWQQVLADCGAPPTADVVPRVGYTAANGVTHRSCWRTRPKGKT